MNQVLETAEKIRSMEIRGAGKIARAAAMALKDFAIRLNAKSLDEFNSEISRAADILLNTRPTAVSLSNAIWMVTKYKADDIESARRAVISNADRFIERL